MDPSSPGEEALSSQSRTEEPWFNARVITVVSRDSSPSPENLPFAKSWGSSSRPQGKFFSQHSRSRSMTDVRFGQKKSPSLYLHWKNDSKVLPSCQANPRRSPHSGRSSRCTTPDPVRNDSTTSLGKQSFDFEKNLSAGLAPPLKGHKRNKSDSGIFPDEYVVRASSSSDSGSLEQGLLNRRAYPTSFQRESSARQMNSRSQFDSMDSESLYSTRDTADGIGDIKQPNSRRHRNHSESELTDSLSQSFEGEYSSSSFPRNRSHRSLESLNWKDSASVSPKFLQSSLGAPEVDMPSEDWGPALRLSSRTDSMEHLYYTGNKLDSRSLDDGDDLNVSWSSTGWRKSVKARSSISSEGSADDVFFGTADCLDSVSDMFQEYLGSRQMVSVLNSESASAKRSATRAKDRSERLNSRSIGSYEHFLSKSPTRSTKPFTTSVVAQSIPSGKHYVRDDEAVNNPDNANLKSSTHNSQQANLQPGNHPPRKPSSDDHSEFYVPSGSSSVLLPHLQKTIEAVRQHIESKKSTCPSSKIPVRVRQQISPRRHRSHSESRETSRRSSSASSKNSVSLEHGDARDLDSNSSESGHGLHAAPITAHVFPGDNLSRNMPSQPPKHLATTAVTMGTAQEKYSYSKARNNNLLVDADDKLSVFSPRPTRTEGDNDNGLAKGKEGTNFIHNKVTFLKTSGEEVDVVSPKENSSLKKAESSPRKYESSLRGSDESVSPRNRSGEPSPRKGKRRNSSRVDYLLNNDLFRKHLSGHIDLVEKNILRVKKFGLKKSFSNLDLTVIDSEKLQAAFDSSLKLQNIDFDSSFKDESKSKDGNSLQILDRSNSTKSEVSTKNEQVVKKTSLDPSQTPRRKSIACDDPSLQQLQEAFRKGKPFSGSVFTAHKRGRMHIPSFNEFRKQRQNDFTGASDNTDASSPSDNLDDMVVMYRTLDTITEDDGMDTSRSAVQTKSERAIPDVRVEHVDDNPTTKQQSFKEQASRERKIASVDPPTGLKQDPLKGAIHRDASEKSYVKRNVRLTVPRKHSKTSRTDSESKNTSSHPNRQRSKDTSKSSSFLSGNENLLSTKAPSTKNKEPKAQTSRKTDGISERRTEKETCHANAGTSSNIEAAGKARIVHSNQSSISQDTMIQMIELSDGEIVLDDGETSQTFSGSTFDGSFSYPLFDETAVSLDTESWARLFTKTHKAKRKEGTSTKNQRRYNSKEHKPPTVPVLRSSSDVTGQATGSGKDGQRKRRLRKERPYKSDPLADGASAIARSSSGCGNNNRNHSNKKDAGNGRSGEAGVMRFLKEGGISIDPQTSSFPSLEELTEESSSENSECEGQSEGWSKKRLSNISTASEDSGVVGQEVSSMELTLGPHSPHHGSFTVSEQVLNCLHCNPGGIEVTIEREDEALLCEKCLHRQQERRDTIYEIIETEINYGRDLRILKEEFFVPMQTTGLLTSEQLDTVFVNLDDLITINSQLTEKLRAALYKAANDCDQKLNLVNIGSLFIESSTMFLAFENYCINQAQASASLEQLERERELLRIFLQVSQAENSRLRRMHLKSFLMVPVQRIMKYPLLLNRLFKATPAHHSDKEDIRQAREKIEDILGHINAKAKGSGSVRIKRKQCELRRYSLTEKIEVNRVALEVLGWSQKDVSDVITSRMWYAQPPDHTWAAKRCRNIKFTPIHAVLLTQGQKRNDNTAQGQQAAVVLVREKNGKYQAVRDPFMLEKSVVTVDPDCDIVFELQEWGREAYIFKAEDPRETTIWVQNLRQQTHNLGQWRRRRNALPNIMLKNI